MTYLLDVNVLVAWGWEDHANHQRTARWIARTKKRRGCRLATSAIPELGFVRISMQQAAGQLDAQQAAATLDGMLKTLGRRHLFLDDSIPSRRNLPTWCQGPRQTTDAHLLMLAKTNGAELATLDNGIPDAFLIPES